jgi:hypothetical protein
VTSIGGGFLEVPIPRSGAGRDDVLLGTFEVEERGSRTAEVEGAGVVAGPFDEGGGAPNAEVSGIE